MSTETIMSRIKTYADSKNLSLRQIENDIGAGNGLLSSAIKRESDINSKWVSLFVEKFRDINPSWLLIGQGDMLIPDTTDTYQRIGMSKSSEALLDRQTIPLYSSIAQAGIKSSNLDHDYPEEYIYIPNMPRCDGAIQITGDSMYPLLKSGDLVAFSLLSTWDYLIWGQMYIVKFCLDDMDYLAVKWVKKSSLGDDYIQLVSENSHHDPLDIPKNSIQKLAIVKASVRIHTTI